MICERLPFNCENKKLFQSLAPLLERYPIMSRSPALGGWALQSVLGSYREGWGLNFCPYNGPDNCGPTWTPRTSVEKGLSPIQDYFVATEIHSLDLQLIIEKLENLGLNPRKARVIKLTALSEGQWHQDGADGIYQVRLHIPLITNSQCFFETKEGKYHMKADGALYFVHVNTPHRVMNFGTTDRYHFVCNIWDRKHITQHHQYQPQSNLGEAYHP